MAKALSEIDLEITTPEKGMMEAYEFHAEYVTFHPAIHRKPVEGKARQIVNICDSEGETIADAYVMKGSRKKDVDREVEALLQLVRIRYAA